MIRLGSCPPRVRATRARTAPPRQYGIGFMAFIINLLVAHMLSLRRTVALVQAISGRRISEATCLNYIRRIAAVDCVTCLGCAPVTRAEDTPPPESGAVLPGLRKHLPQG